MLLGGSHFFSSSSCVAHGPFLTSDVCWGGHSLHLCCIPWGMWWGQLLPPCTSLSPPVQCLRPGRWLWALVTVLSCHFLPWAFPLWASCCLWCRIWNTGRRVLLLWLSWGMKRHWKQGDTIMGFAHSVLVAIHCSCSLPQDQWIADFFLCRWYQLFLKLLVDNPFVFVNNWSISNSA